MHKIDLDVVLFGDSYANGHAPDGTTGHLADALGLPAYNRHAVSGSTAQQWARGDMGWLDAVVSSSAQTAVGALGGNDFFAAASDGYVTLEERVTAMAALFYCLMRLRRKDVLLLLYPDPFFGGRPDVQRGHRELCVCIRAVARLAHADGAAVGILDLGNVLTTAHFDGRDIHPNADGYGVIAAAIRRRLGGAA
jgi:lysophospholipase L1-like esterase